MIIKRCALPSRGAHAPSRVAVGALADRKKAMHDQPIDFRVRARFLSSWRGATKDARGRVCSPGQMNSHDAELRS